MAETLKLQKKCDYVNCVTMKTFCDSKRKGFLDCDNVPSW